MKQRGTRERKAPRRRSRGGRRTPSRTSRPAADGQEAAAPQAQGAHGASAPPTPKRRGRRLKTVSNVRRGLADVIRRLEAGNMDVKLGRSLIYGLSQLAAVIGAADLEQRIAALERKS